MEGKIIESFAYIVLLINSGHNLLKDLDKLMVRILEAQFSNEQDVLGSITMPLKRSRMSLMLWKSDRSVNVCSCELVKKVQEKDAQNQLIEFMMGLSAEFDGVCSNILSTDHLPTVNRAYYLVQQVERIFEHVCQVDFLRIGNLRKDDLREIGNSEIGEQIPSTMKKDKFGPQSRSCPRAPHLQAALHVVRDGVKSERI
ncbi:hypothetical protein V2J09_009094 [Rumex salicifolius]